MIFSQNATIGNPLIMPFKRFIPETQKIGQDPDKIDDILGKSGLAGLLKKARLIADINQCLTHHLPISLLTQCQVLNYENSIVVIGVSSAAWATQLRYENENLLSTLQADERLPNILGIKYKVSPMY